MICELESVDVAKSRQYLQCYLLIKNISLPKDINATF